MILINLLPHREERRKRRKVAFFAGLGVAAAAGLAVVGVWYLVVQQLTSAQQERNEFLKAEIKQARSPDQGHRHAEGRDRIAEGAPEGGRRPADRPQRAGPPAQRTGQADARGHLPHDDQAGRPGRSTVSGIAQTKERVSELLRNTAYNSEWLVKPELVESKASHGARLPTASSAGCSSSRCA